MNESIIFEVSKDKNFDLKESFYKNKLKSFGTALIKLIKESKRLCYQKINNIHKTYISSNTDKFQNIHSRNIDQTKSTMDYEG